MRDTNKDKGITLIALTITVIILLVLASITTYTGINTIKSSKLTKFKQQLEIMQAQVDMLYEKYKKEDGTLNEEEINKIGKDISSYLDTEEVDDIFNQVYSIDSIDSINRDTYRYYDKETIENLGVSGIEDEYLVSIYDRLVISINGIESEGTLYRVLYQFPDKERVSNNFERGEVSFSVDTEQTSNGWRINISNIEYSKYVGKGNIQYRKSTSSEWTTVEENIKDKNYSFDITSSGKYIIKITDAAGISSEQEIVVLKDGEVFDETPWELTGDGTEDNPFLIESIEDLVAFSNSVNEGERYANKYVKLSITLDFNSDSSYVNPNTKVSEKTNRIIKEDTTGTPLKEFLTTGTGFNPIGGNKYEIGFYGNFDGNGKEIKNIFINRPNEDNVALFSNEKKATDGGTRIGGKVNNIGISGKITGANNVGGITAVGLTIENSYNKANITGNSNVGGIGGTSSEVKNCYNLGKVILNAENNNGSKYSVAGILANVQSGEVRNCYNLGEIQINNKGFMIGGIVAYGSKIYNCYNLGEIISLNKNSYGAGISANPTSGGTIENCYNVSVIDSDKFYHSGRNLR